MIFCSSHSSFGQSMVSYEYTYYFSVCSTMRKKKPVDGILKLTLNFTDLFVLNFGMSCSKFIN
jgi:hypothetical protein